jgi:transposase-like protein
MSDEESKIKHSKRILKTENIIKKQTKIAKAHGMEVKEPHKLAKHHALDCGVPNCPMCSSPRKVTGEKTKQEQSFEQTEKWND